MLLTGLWEVEEEEEDEEVERERREEEEEDEEEEGKERGERRGGYRWMVERKIFQQYWNINIDIIRIVASVTT